VTSRRLAASPEHRALTDSLLAASAALVGIAVRSIARAPVEVTVVQFRVLMLLHIHEPLTVTAIADQLGVNQSNASRVCDRLARSGLLDRTRSAEDGRVVEVRLTAPGEEVVRAVTAARRREIAEIVSGMSAETARSVASALLPFHEAAREAAGGEPSVASPW
jgi:DNA-binding MarR family transcriptional regulator